MNIHICSILITLIFFTFNIISLHAESALEFRIAHIVLSSTVEKSTTVEYKGQRYSVNSKPEKLSIENIKAIELCPPPSPQQLKIIERIKAENPYGIITLNLFTITFDEEGAKEFKNITSTHLGENIATYLDGKLLSIGKIRDIIPDGVVAFTDTPGAKEIYKILSEAIRQRDINKSAKENIK